MIAERLAQVAADKGATRAQVALAWLLSKPAVTAPIIGASRAEQFADLVNAVNVELTPDDIAKLEEAYQPHPATGYQ